MRIAIVDLKWSYGIESLSTAIREELLRYAEVELISATESQLPYSIKIAKSRTATDMVLAFVNPIVHLRLIRSIIRMKPDVVYINSPHLLNPVVAAFCRVFTDIYVISHVHDPDYYGSPHAAFVANSIAFFLSRVSNRVYCLGTGIRDMICERFRVCSERVAVFRHGPNQKTFYDSHDARERLTQPEYFAFIGSVHPRKGIQFFLEAAYEFNQRHGTGRVKFLLAGAGDARPYREMINRLPNLLVVNRFIENDEINDMLGRSYALVLPYVGGMLQSSFPAIAYGNGCPVIASRIGSLYEEIDEGKTGYVVDKENASEITEAMCKVVDSGKYADLSRNAMNAYLQKFQWKCIGEEIYRDMKASLSRARNDSDSA